MIAKIAIITGLVIVYFLIGLLMLFAVNKFWCWFLDGVLLDEDTGVIFVFFHPIAMPIVLIVLLLYVISRGIERINDIILGEYEEDDEDEED